MRLELRAAWIASLLGAATAVAHHAAAPVYDNARIATVEGVVSQFRLVNPHSTLLLEATDESKRAVTWTVEFQGLNDLSRSGWMPETFRRGERLRVSGALARDGSPAMFFRSATRANGDRVVPPGREEVEAIDALRRERAEQRRPQ